MANRSDLVVAAKAGDGDAHTDLIHLETPEAHRLTQPRRSAAVDGGHH
jgi:hypothetical protein